MLQVAATNQSLHSDARPAPLGVALMIIPSTISTHTFTIMVAVGRQDACDWFRHKQAAAAAKRGYPTMRERLRQPGDKAALQHQAHARHPRDTTAQHRASHGTRWLCGSLPVAPQAVVRLDRSAIRPRSHAAGTPSIQRRQPPNQSHGE